MAIHRTERRLAADVDRPGFCNDVRPSSDPRGLSGDLRSPSTRSRRSDLPLRRQRPDEQGPTLVFLLPTCHRLYCTRRSWTPSRAVSTFCCSSRRSRSRLSFLNMRRRPSAFSAISTLSFLAFRPLLARTTFYDVNNTFLTYDPAEAWQLDDADAPAVFTNGSEKTMFAFAFAGEATKCLLSMNGPADSRSCGQANRSRSTAFRRRRSLSPSTDRRRRPSSRLQLQT